MNRIKQLAALCVLAFPVAAFAAGGSATGTVTHVYINASYTNAVYVTLSGVKTGNPACSTSSRGQFIIPVNSGTDYVNMVSLVLSARATGASITITGQNTCNVDTSVETIQDIDI